MALLNEIKQRSPLRSILDFSLAGILLTFLFLSPWFHGLTRFRDQLIAEVLIFTLFLISLLFLETKGVFRLGERRIDFWVFLALAVGLFYVAFSALPYRSLLAFLRLAACVLFYTLIRCVVRTETRLRVFLWAILISGVFYSIYGLTQYHGFLPHSFWYQPTSLASRYVNGGHFAVFLFFPLFIGMALATSNRNLFVQAVLAALLLVVAWAFFLTRSRAAWIAFLVGFLIFIRKTGKDTVLPQRRILGLTLWVMASGALLFGREVIREIVERFQQLWTTTKFYSLDYRWELWKGSLTALRERPWGWGLGTFSAVFPQFQSHTDRFFVDYAHNEFAQVGVDLGILGILLLIGFLAFYFRGSASCLRREPDNSPRRIYAASFSALLISLILASQFDFPLRIYATSFFFTAFLALSSYLFNPPQERGYSRNTVLRVPLHRWRGYLFRFFSALCIFVLGTFSARQLFAQIHFEKGQVFEKNFDWQNALGEYEKAIHLAPSYSDYYDALGSLARKKALLALRRADKNEFFDKAIEAYQEAARLYPYKAFYHYFLAELYERKGELKKAQSEFLKAVSLEPNNPLFISEYGYFAVRHSLTKEALWAFERYQAIPFKEGTRSYLIDIIRGCYRLTDDYSQLRRIVPNSPEGHFSLGQVLGEEGRWDLAKQEFDFAIELSPVAGPSSSLPRTIADFYLSKNRLREAWEVYRMLRARNPKDTEVRGKFQDLTERLKTIETAPPLSHV